MKMVQEPFQDNELEELLKVEEDSYFPVSCQEYADNGVINNGSYRVQPNVNISRYFIKILRIYRIK